jgi:FHA domain
MSASLFGIELLDTESGQVLQSWDLAGSDVFQVGRSRESDVVLASPFVSRTHVWVQRSDDGWELSVVSQNGVFVDSKRVDHVRLEDGLVFRLGERGPSLRYRAAHSGGGKSGGETICFDAARISLLVLDEQQRDRDVGEIADGDYFQELQRKLARLRVRPAPDGPTSTDHRN